MTITMWDHLTNTWKQPSLINTGFNSFGHDT